MREMGCQQNEEEDGKLSMKIVVGAGMLYPFVSPRNCIASVQKHGYQKTHFFV